MQNDSHQILCIAVLQSILLWWVIKKNIIYIIVIYTWRGTFDVIVHWPTTILFFLIVFYIKLSWDFAFLTIIESVLLWYFQGGDFAAVKWFHKFWFRSTTTSADTKFVLPKPSYYWKTDHYWGSADHGEVDLDSDVNRLASGNILQYTTVPSQCEWFPWTWTCWYSFENCPGIV